MTLPPPPEPFVGREQQVHDTRTAILQRIPAVIYGLIGVGKGSVCLAAGHSPPVSERHAANAWVVDCEGCGTKERLLARTVDAVYPEGGRPNTGVGRGAEFALEGTLLTCTENQQPALLIFDNVEDLLRGPDCEAMLHLVRLWAEAGMTVVLLGVHSATEPRVLHQHAIGGEALRPIEVPRLTDEEATELFLGLAPRYANDPELPAVIEALDGLALALALVARSAFHSNPENLGQIRKNLHWTLADAGAADTGESRQSISASVKLAVDVFKPDHAEDRDKRQLLALLGRLPAGISVSDLPALVTSGDAAADAVAEMGLAFLDDSESLLEPRWRTLKPVRDWLAGLCDCPQEDLAAVRDHYLGYVDDAGCNPSREAYGRVVKESENIDTMIELVDDPRQRCDMLLSKGESEWLAGRSELSLPTFGRAAEIARREGDAVRLARAALGFSGGMTGSGHSFDHADPRRLALLREALAELGDQDAELRLRLLTRLLQELHFDATAAGATERKERRAEARETAEHVTDQRASLTSLLQQLSEAGPKTVPPAQRMDAADNVIGRAQRLGDVGAELSARLLRTFALMEDGQTREGSDEIARCRSLAESSHDDRGLWKVRVMERAMMLFVGRFDVVREELDTKPSAVERSQGIVAERRSLHQRIVLAMDSGDLTAVVGDVNDLVHRLRKLECETLNLSDAELRHLRYQWWPTWRANLALVLAGTSQDDEASEVLYSLGRDGFEDIMPAEYWLQVLAVIGIAAAWNYDHDPDSERLQRLYDLLLPYAERSIVPGSVAMNLGSVSTVLGMLAARLRMWDAAMEHLRTGLEHNDEIGSPPAVARTQLELAMLHQRRAKSGEKEANSRRAATDAATRCLHVSRELGMDPLTRQATDIRRWAAATP